MTNTSKKLVWTVIVMAFVLAIAILAVAAWRDALIVGIPAAAGVFTGTTTLAYKAYSVRAAAHDDHKQAMRQPIDLAAMRDKLAEALHAVNDIGGEL